MRRLALLVPLLAAGCDRPHTLGELALPRVPPLDVLVPRPARATPAPPRLGALDLEVYVRQSPRPSSPEIGVLHIGASVVRGADPVSRTGCAGGWYAVQPEGYVCHDRATTLEPDRHPLLLAKQSHAGDFTAARPYRWYESRGDAPLYKRIPTPDEQRRSEAELERHLRRSHVDLGGYDQDIPDFLTGGALSPWARVHTPGDRRPRLRFVPPRSTVAVTSELGVAGRRFLLTSDLLLVPADRVKEQVPSTFAGVHLDGARVRLPIAFVRGEPKPRFRMLVPDVLPASTTQTLPRPQPTGTHFARLSWLALTGRSQVHRSKTYLETSAGDWIRESDATVVQSEEPRGLELAPGEKWLDVSIFRGTLVAYEGPRAVFATLISPGAHGYRRENGQPAKYTTPTGTFRLEWKHRSTTMTPDPERLGYYLSEVPYTQFFHMPFALHAAYWHDRFGEPKSGGCVNLSPQDARWLFAWTAPAVPDGWHGVRSGGARGPGTWVRIR